MIKVLFIGTDPQTAEVANHLRLRWPEAKSLVADGGADGLELLEQTSPDMVLLYSSLPDMALAKAIWGLRGMSNVLLLVLGHPEGEKEIVSALQIGADAYVKLPCDTAELMARISSLLQRAGSPVRQEEKQPILTSSMVLNPATYEVFTGEQWVTLTPAQFRLLNRLLSDASLENKPTAAQDDYAKLVAEINGRPFKESVEPQQEIESAEPQQEIEYPLSVETQWDYLLSGEERKIFLGSPADGDIPQ